MFIKSRTKVFLSLMLVFGILTGCSLPGSEPPTPTIDPNSILTSAAATAFIRLTQSAANATHTPSPTSTSSPIPEPTKVILPTSIPTIVPITGVVRANANVRSLPSKSKANDVGGVLFGQSVGVIGRNDAATWLYILYSDSPTGTGWVIANAVTLSKEMGVLPILIFPGGLEAEPIMIPPFLFEVKGTPLPPSTPPAGWDKYGTIIQPANVRIGPSVGFVTIGVLKPGQVVTFRGRIVDNVWVQIDYPSGPDGRGWILSSLVQANDGFGSLPFYDVMGTPVTPIPEQPKEPAGSEVTITPQSKLEISATVTPAENIGGIDAVVTNQINVRAGPAQTYKSYGLLNPKDKVIVTGVTLNNYWYQIKFSSSPNGYGWAAVQYIKILGDARKIPYFNNEGTQVAP